MFGIDYASVDGNSPPDFALARSVGLRFAFLRAAYSTWQDPIAARDREAVRASGLIFGAYLFPVMSTSAPDPEDQVDVFLRSAKLDSTRDFAPVLDLEWPGGVSATGRTRAELAVWIRRARARIKTTVGVDPIIYSSARVLDGTDSDSMSGAADEAVRGCPAWCARYPFRARIPAVIDANTLDNLAAPPVPRALGDADAWWIHQDQGDALYLPGFSSTVDVNRFHMLSHGAKGTRVAWVQKRIGMAGADPTWGFDMDDKVRAYQAAHGLAADAIVGPITFARLSWEIT